MAGTADDIIAYAKANGGCGCSFHFEPAQIDRPGSAGLHGQHRAVDFGTANCGAAGVRCIYNLFLPLAMGPGYTVEELFAHDGSGYLASWSHGAPSSFRDNPSHCHVGIRAGATLGGGIARTAVESGFNPLDPFGDVADSALKAVLSHIADMLAKVPAALLGAVFGDHSVAEFFVRALEVLAGAILLAVGATMIWKATGAGKATRAIGKPTRGARRKVRQQVRKQTRSATSERPTTRAKRAAKVPGEAVEGATIRGTETVAGGKAKGANLRKMVARAV